jgi:hypothetical protein
MSRKGLLENPIKRSSLSRVTSLSTPAAEPTIESRNKEAISRLVMAGMRLYGLQQKKRPKSTRDGAGETEASREEEERKDEEYKLVYHQIYRATVVAFRRHIQTEPLHQQPDSLHETVDKLLVLFCTDPLDRPGAEDLSFGKQRGRGGGLETAEPE